LTPLDGLDLAGIAPEAGKAGKRLSMNSAGFMLY
jgi:hypothetical protein